MKHLLTILLLFCTTTLANASELATSIVEGGVYSEDITWRGVVHVKGAVIVAPQATLRIEAGTVVRFHVNTAHPPHLLIQGRLYAAGTAEKPIVIKSDRAGSKNGSWGGISFLSTEKKNLIEHSRLENAGTAIDLKFSRLSLAGVTISDSAVGLLSHDSVVTMTGSRIANCETGMEMYNSELELKGSTIDSCRQGALIKKSAVLFENLKVNGSNLAGVVLDQCRIRVQGGLFSNNKTALKISGGEGEISMTAFNNSLQTALHLSGARIKIQKCLFTGNGREGVLIEESQALLMNNAFETNSGYHLHNAGASVVDARLNWWGSDDSSQIEKKIYDRRKDSSVGYVGLYPWLQKKPQFMP